MGVADDDRIDPGDKVGRYVILERVGEGGMGVVYAAYDPELDRRVALKILRGHGSRDRSDQDVARLLREARAIARVSHPNVIGVFDVDSVGDVMFIAMEYVEGPTLARWIRLGRRSVAEVLAIFCEAGQGLAAAHGVGIVHRDFKPSNVIVEGGRRARVLDFGLARADPGSSRSEPPAPSESFRDAVLARDAVLNESSGHDLLSTALTRKGVVLGTPWYMAPEQYAGIVADAKSDQYAFCVALYQALFGQAPFESSDIEHMVVAKRMGLVRSPPAHANVPRHVTAAVIRGLAVDPGQRWPDMRTLIEVLGRDSAGARRRWLGMGATAAAAAVTAGVAVYAGARLESPCQDAEARLTGVWDDARKDSIGDQLGTLAVPYAADVRDRVALGLDDYSARWSAMYVDACEATHVRSEQSAGLLDRRMICLESRRAALLALVDVLGSADRSVASRAQEAVAGLPPIETCGDMELLVAAVEPPDPAHGTAVADLRTRLAEVGALSAAGRYEDAHTLAKDAWVQAEAIDYPPLHAEALLELGVVERVVGEHEGAQDHLVQALLVATANKHDLIAADAATELAAVEGVRLARTDEGLRWASLARGLYQRLGIEGLALAGLDLHEGAVYEARGDLDLARAAYERAIAAREEARGADDPIAALWSVNLANVNFLQARYHEALSGYERAAATAERAWGPAHPNNVIVAIGHANALIALGRYDQAQAQLVRAAEVASTSLPDGHPWGSAATCTLGLVQERRGDGEAALATFERCRAANLQATGREHPEYARALENLGRVQRDLGHLDDARRSLQDGYDLRRRLLGDDSGETTWAALELAELERVSGDLPEAERRFLAVVAAFAREGGDEVGLARARFGLARVRWAIAGPSVAARDLAEQARVTLAADVEQARHLRVLDAWLAEHAVQ
jgi:tetratricopeptide (TPR) repeat protein/predicted Ser/Thr protein kinase